MMELVIFSGSQAESCGVAWNAWGRHFTAIHMLARSDQSLNLWL